MLTRFIDLDTSEFRKQLTASPVIVETSKRRAKVSLAIQFVRDAAAVELVAQTSGLLTVGQSYVITTFVAGDDFTNVGAASNASGTSFVATGTTPTTWTHSSALDSVTLGFKAPAGYDSVAYVLGPFTAVKTGTAEDGDVTYTFTIEFLNALLDQLLAGNLEEVTLLPEIRWASLDENGETLAFDWVIQNNVQRGGESVPSYPVTAVTVGLRAVSRLTGGVLATDLDAQLLLGYPNGSVFEVVTYNATLDGRVESRWEKDNTRTETSTDVAAGIIICLDTTKLFRVSA